jgi:polysaccharide pyruvyl transferase WcaK-like protein
MTADVKCILVADFVPLANKGEEAIIRGIEDMLRDDQPIEIGLFDNVAQPTQIGNIVVFPRDWIFRLEGKVWRSRRQRALRGLLTSLQMRLSYYSKLKNVIPSPDQKYQPLHKFFTKADLVLVGHNGIFFVESCGIIHLTKKAGKRAGILGSGSRVAWYRRPYVGWLYRRTIKESDFCTCRDCYSYEDMQQIIGSSDKLILGPDPAFAMQAASQETASQVLESYESYRAARKIGKHIVGVTVREKGIPYVHSFLNVNPSEKRQIHAKFVARVLDCLVEQRNAFVVFLPHSIEQDSSDVDAAYHICEVMSSDPQSRIIIDEDLGARLLKSIIRECDFLIGERAHSIIACVSVGTPFIALTNTKDSRTHGIIGQMCGCEEQIIDMDEPDVEQTCEKVVKTFDNRTTMRESLERTSEVLLNKLEEISKIVKGKR